MNQFLNYFSNILKVLIWPILFGIGQFAIIVIFTLIYNANLSIEGNKLMDYIQTAEYQINLSNYLNDYKLLIVLISTIIFLPIFIRLYEKYKHNFNNTLSRNNILYLILFGISFALTFNISVYFLNNIFDFTNLYSNNIIETNLLVTIICTGILGPILEEYLYRGIVYNKLLKFMDKKNAIFLVTMIFALMHSNYVDIIYAFMIGLILIYAYEYYKTIKAPIIIHISANTSIILFLKFIMDSHYIIGSIILIIMIIIFVFLLKNIKKDKILGLTK